MEVTIMLKSIGLIHTPYKRLDEVPIQPSRSEAIGEVELAAEYEEGLKDIEGFSHITLVYLFHKSEGYSLLVKPFLDDQLRGVFATRSPRRPNPVGISTVRLLERQGNILRVLGIDVLDGTPLIDVKPYVPAFECEDMAGVRIGWLEDKVKRP